jgi:hypothetical protein
MSENFKIESDPNGGYNPVTGTGFFIIGEPSSTHFLTIGNPGTKFKLDEPQRFSPDVTLQPGEDHLLRIVQNSEEIIGGDDQADIEQ